MTGIRKVAIAAACIIAVAGLLAGVSARGYYRTVSVPPPQGHYLIEHVTLIDVVGQQVLKDHHVEIKAGKIHRVIASSETEQENFSGRDDVRRIDGRGKYLMPGLWDMHTVLTRLSPELDYPLLVAYGVTNLRSIVSCPNQAKVSLYPCLDMQAKWNRQVAQGDIIGPLIHGSGTFPVNGTASMHPDAPGFHGAATVADALQLVEHYRTMPAHQRPFFIKNYNWVQPEPYLEMVSRARQEGFEVGGHMPRYLGLVGAVEAGQRSFAHARLFMFECSTEAQALRKGKHWDRTLADLYRLLLETHDSEICLERYQLLSDSDVYLSPTLLTRRNDYLALAGTSHLADGGRYSPYLIKFMWQEDIDGLSEQPEADAPVFKSFYEASAQTILKAHEQGAKVMVGTDANDVLVVPGVSVHEEMALLHQAGMSNFDVLAAATRVPAQYFRKEPVLGSIEPGMEASMLLLDANPVEDIANTRAINMVFQGPYIYDQDKLEALKARARARARSHWVTLKFLTMWASNPKGF